jgi:hypothetical protein
MKLYPFQKRAFAAAALVKGLILAAEQGLGKTFGAFCVPYVWRSRRVLIVAPGDLHEQYRQEAITHFGIVLRSLVNADDVDRYHVSTAAAPLRKGRMPAYYLTTYEALTKNGADEWEPKVDAKGKALAGSREKSRLIEARSLAKEFALARLLGRKPDFASYMAGVGKSYENITCVWKPSLARILKQLEGIGAGFDCIVLDEATAIQSDESQVTRGVTLLNPEFRMLMTGTPVKNRVESIFTLAWWAAGGHSTPVSRWPYAPDGKDAFARQHLEIDRFVTREEERSAATRQSRGSIRITKTTARVCNLQRLWRVFAPITLRVRKDDCGEALVAKIVRPMEVAMGSAQAAVYEEHLRNRPSGASGCRPGSLHALASAGMQLTNLRIAALCPDMPSLAEVVSNAHPSRKRSWTPWTPKLAAVLSLISELLDQGEQVIVGSPLTRFTRTLHEHLLEAGVESYLLDGDTPPRQRGLFAAAFKRGDAAVLCAGMASMARGHSFENCAHLITAAYPWAMDELAQFIDRIWRLSSKRPITIYPIVTSGSIEERMRDVYGDKSDTARLSLDGRLFPETVEDMDPERLLADAYDTFARGADRQDENVLEAGWPSLSKRLSWSQVRFREWHPPIIETLVTAADLAAARLGITSDPLFDFAVAKERFRQELLLRKQKPDHGSQR